MWIHSFIRYVSGQPVLLNHLFNWVALHYWHYINCCSHEIQRRCGEKRKSPIFDLEFHSIVLPGLPPPKSSKIPSKNLRLPKAGTRCKFFRVLCLCGRHVLIPRTLYDLFRRIFLSRLQFVAGRAVVTALNPLNPLGGGSRNLRKCVMC